MADLPAAVLTATIWGYWGCVAAMIVRLRRKHGRGAGVVPRQTLERLMWLVWVPLVVAPEWADAHPDESAARPGPEIVGEFFGTLTGKELR